MDVILGDTTNSIESFELLGSARSLVSSASPPIPDIARKEKHCMLFFDLPWAAEVIGSWSVG